MQQPDRAPAEGPVDLTVRAYFTIPQSWSKKKQAAAADGLVPKISKPDLDNCLKAVSDGLNKVAWRDDSQINEIHAFKAYSDRPRVDIIIKTEEGENDGINQ